MLSAGRSWLDRHAEGALLLCHHDADGLAAGALLHRRTGGEVRPVSGPEEHSISGPGAVVIADLGVRAVDAKGEVLYVDHHADPEPVGGTVVAPAEGGGETSTSLLAWELLGQPEDGAWLAAVGAVGDLGRDALKDGRAPRAAPVGALGRLATLATAPGRLRDGPTDTAFALLRESRNAEAALVDPRLDELRQAKEAVAAARARAVKTAPQVGPDAALIRFDEPARVHGLVAAAWSRRLAPRVVVAANDGWRDGRISFAVRSAEDIDLRAWLRGRYEPPPEAGDYARGHARATGGNLVPEAFEEFAAALLR